MKNALTKCHCPIDTIKVCLLWQHARQKRIRSALFCGQLIGSLFHNFFQMIGIFLQFAHHVVQDVGMAGKLIKQPRVNKTEYIQECQAHQTDSYIKCGPFRTCLTQLSPDTGERRSVVWVLTPAGFQQRDETFITDVSRQGWSKGLVAHWSP